MMIRRVVRLAGILGLSLAACSDPTGLPKAVSTPGTFRLYEPDSEIEGTAVIDYSESEGEIIRLTDEGSGLLIELFVGPNPLAPALSQLPPADLPSDYIRWIRVVISGDAPIDRTYQVVRGSYEGQATSAGTRIQMDLWLRSMSFGLDASPQPELRLRGSLWAVWPPM